MKLNAKFDLPEVFVQAHSTELLTWARDLQKYGPLLKVKLKRVPGGLAMDVLAATLPEGVTLACSLLKQEASGDRLFLIAPHTKFDAEMIAIYSDRLPAIERARAEYIERERAKRGQVDAVFEPSVPGEFVEAYRAELAAWGQNFGKSGGGTTVVLRRIPGAEVKLDQWGQEPMVGVELVATVEKLGEARIRLLIKPADEQSEELIRRHVEDIRRYGEPLARRAN